MVQQQSRKHSVKYIWDPQKGATVQLSVDPAHAGNAATASPCISNTESVDQTDSNSNQVLTTGQLVSVVGRIWGYAAHPLSSNRSSENREARFTSSQNNGLIYIASESDKGQEHIVGTRQKVQSKPDVSAFCVDAVVDHGSSSPIGSGIVSATKFSEEKIFSGLHISKELRNMYKWMSHSYPLVNNMSRLHRTVIHLDGNVIDCSIQKDSKSCLANYADSEKNTVSVNMVSSGTTDCKPTTINLNSLASSESGNCTHVLFSGTGTSLHKADCLVRAINAIEQSIHSSTGTSSSHNYTFEERSAKIDDQLNDRQIQQGDELDIGDLETTISIAACNKSRISLAKQQHAVAGAMAGVCVSLCLHPVDTVKTVVQSCHLDQKSISDIGRSIVSERGLSGLYRGIASNIASSAPISAVYTFTYESVKGVLLPLFPKEYCSIAHCMAGGCASVATSVIFTPSECIKQQMQVRSKYPNCWSALIGIIQKGGLASLYAGWGAVLCRNVPHSIIKFYAYENLKRSMMSSLQCSELDTLQTLACGGIAGSTAALFSTPFDVVKTRLQTQVPGSENRYRGVVQAIHEIRKSEGFKGLYRGLAPRLIMYMTQGGLFFASYEFFKRTLGLRTLQHSH